MMRSAVVLLFWVAAPALAARLAAVNHPSNSWVERSPGRLVTMPMFLNSNDCWKKKQPFAMTQLAAKVFKVNDTLPGAGINAPDQKGYGTVMKDGYYEVACVADFMYTHGDAVGANKHEYQIGDKANVSIVHYSMLVPKEDREPMSADVCFNFCRTVPDMLYFGLMAGRECYCAPYFKQMAGDSSKCDAVCEGSPTTMCGGMSKSSIYGMHFCDSTAEDLADGATKAGDFLTEAEPIAEAAMKDAEALQAAGEAGQAAFGNVGDTVMSDLMQTAKVFAGEFTHSIEDAMKDGKALSELVDKAKDLDGADFTDPEKMKEAEDLMKSMDEGLSKVETAGEEAMKLHELAKGTKYADGELKKVDGEPLKQYVSIMKFVDPSQMESPSTCGGDTLLKPILADDAQVCAAACDAEGMKCAGFDYVSLKDEKDKVCFLFTKFKSVSYYTECKSFLQKPLAFLQNPGVHAAIQKVDSNVTVGKRGSDATMCYAKFSSFSGTTLKPDPSGKCKACLKTADKLQRCYE